MAKLKQSTDHFHVFILILAAIALAGTALLTMQTRSLALENLQANKETSVQKCDTKGEPIINITQKVVKTVDSGEGGNNWAFDNLNRQIKVYKQGENAYCAVMDNEGQFDSQEGQRSPGDTGVLTGKEDGTFKGGYRAIIIGTLLEDPTLQTKGNIGSVNYDCDIDGNCPGYYNWVEKYFSPGYIFNYEWWGWEYKYKNSKWINASSGNSGDII